MELVFWVCAALVVYAYAGYAALLLVLGRLRSRPVRRSDVTPTISMIITARNEEGRIGAKLAQSLELDYPRDRLEIIVASDCSTDGTHAIVESYRGRVRLVVAPERRGKEFAQKQAIDASTGEILVFSDVATRLDRDGLRHLARNFADPDVGCVSSVDRLVGPNGEVSGEGLYVRYEMLLRSLESSIGSVVGLSGSLFAARRQVCTPWPIDLPSDFTTQLNSLRLGLRGISDPASIGYYPDLADRSREYPRKVRTITRGITSLVRHLHLLNPFSYGLTAWQLFSHKICRWMVPFALIGMFVTNMLLLRQSPFYLVSGLAQLATYLVAGYGYRRPERLSTIPRTITFFVLANASILHAWFNVLAGRQIVTWEPSKRPDAVSN
jgi:glycosyltransferase involved in cell wall biosynthesis